MALDFTGKTAVISGGASGMGLLAGQELAKRGASVVLCDINGEALEKYVTEINEKGGKAVAAITDVRIYEQVEAAIQRAVENFGRVDILITCAGGYEGRMLNRTADFKEMEISTIDWSIDVNLRGAIYFARAAMPYMVKQKSGSIITLGSVDGVTGAPNVYSICKMGCTQLAKTLAIYGAPYGIRANCVSPGPVLTRPGMASMQTRLGRAAEPIEVVNLMLYLSSEKAAFITGANYVIDGGRSCGTGIG